MPDDPTEPQPAAATVPQPLSPAATAPMAPVARAPVVRGAASVRPAPQLVEQVPRSRPAKRRSGGRRFVTAVCALILLLAVPVVSAYVAYKLASGENPFAWPPTVDLSHAF